MKICKFCGNEYSNGVHIRWCKENPLYDLNVSNQSKATSANISEIVKKAHKDGKYDERNKKQKEQPNWLGRKHTEETKRKLSEICLKQTHRRLVKSCRNYTCKDGSIILLDSSWEEILAKRLDDLDIKWIRPKEPVPYELDGKMHNYFPDFYLIDHDLYLDPKNAFAYKVQERKLNIIFTILPNLVILKTEKDCKEFDIRHLPLTPVF